MLFQDALKARLDIMQPSWQNVQDFLSAHPPRISPGAIPPLLGFAEAGRHSLMLESDVIRQMKMSSALRHADSVCRDP